MANWKKIIAREWLYLLIIPVSYAMAIVYDLQPMGPDIAPAIMVLPYPLVQAGRITLWAFRTVKGGE